jgi:hypothetical protein
MSIFEMLRERGLIGKHHKEDETIIFIEHLVVNFSDECHTPRLRLIVFFHNKNTCMSTVNAVNFTTTAPDQGVIAVVDTANSNALLTGTLANLSAVGSDPTQDTFSIDPSVANTLDVAPVTNTGSSLGTVKGDFTSQGNAGITDGTVFPGITVQVAATNNIPTTPPPPPTPVPGLQVTFP